MCTSQRLAYREKGEKKLHFVPYRPDDLALDIEQYKYNFRYFGNGAVSPENTEWFLLPCGQCAECRLERSRDTANRIFLEVKESTDCWGVTLTYDEEHLPYGPEVLDGQGEFVRYPTLVSEDPSKFVKRLRRIMERECGVTSGIKFYLAAEYGSERARPHYHFIFFNLPLPASDVKLCKNETSQTGEEMYVSRIIERAWSYYKRDEDNHFVLDKDGKRIEVLRGRVRLNAVTWQYAAYCARYIMKKQLGSGAEKYKILGILPEFTRCSTKEGIGRKYFEKHKDVLLKSDKVLIKQGDEVFHASLPKYFLRLAEKEGIDLTEIKEKRQAEARANVQKIRAAISQDFFEYKENLEDLKKNQLNALPRGDV